MRKLSISNNNLDMYELKKTLRRIIPIQANVKKLPLIKGYIHCFLCDGIYLKNRSCSCSINWKYWESNFEKIIRSVSPYWLQSQYQNLEMKSSKTGSLLEVDFVGKK